MTTRTHERSYTTARAVYAFEEFVGWTIAFIGALFALAAFLYSGLGTPFSSMPAFLLHAGATVPGLVAVVAGVFSVANSQTNRAIVDNAELTRDILAIARRATNASDGTWAKTRIEPSISMPRASGTITPDLEN